MGLGFGITKTSSGGGGGGTTITTVANYSALPLATAVSGKFYWCEASQGTKWLPFSVGGTYYPLGMYYSNGVTWEYTETPYQATLSEVNTGTNTDKFVSPYTFTNADKWSNYTPTSTTISTTSPLQGGGNLSANRTFSITQSNTTTDGYLSSTDWNTFNGKGVGSVTSVGLTMPTAFTVTNSPITSSGTIAVAGAGLSSQYIRGDGQLATFPTSTGGGSSVAYYLNGSVNQGTFGGNTYYQMSKTPIIGAGTDFSISADGFIARFITDANDPSQLSVPSGNWNLEFFFSASSSGGTPTFYVNVYKYNGGFTLIGTNSTAPEGITNGTVIDSYFTAVSIPTTSLSITDRLAIDIYVVHSGRTITLHTEDNHLDQVITTFSSGLTALNGLTKQVQYFATGTSGTDFNISSVTDTHTFNLPTASATNRGALSSANWTTFNSKIGGSGTTNYLPKFTASSTIGNSQIQDNGTGVGIGIAPLLNYRLNVYGALNVYSSLRVGLTAIGETASIGAEIRGLDKGISTETASDSGGISVYANTGNAGGETQAGDYIGGFFSSSGGNGGVAYSVQLQDGTEGVGKFLKSVTADGKANWATLSATSPLNYNSGTNVFSIQVANATQNGYLSSTDWNTFNSANFIPKLSATETYRGININNNSTTVVTEGGVTMSSSASTTAQSVASTNFSTKQIRLRYSATVVSGGRYTGTRGSALLWFLHGGFRFICDFNISDTAYSAGCQQFYGLSGVTTDLAYGTVSGTLVSTLTNIVGVGSETGDTNLQVFHNDGTGTATKVDLGVNFPANRTVGAISTTVYSIQLYNECMSTDVKYEVKNNETGSIASGTISTNLPLTSQGLNFFASRCMAVTSVTSTGQFDLSKLGVYSLL